VPSAFVGATADVADSLDEAKAAFRAAQRLFRQKKRTRNAQLEPICS
jgi:hypothetical protein